MSNGGSPGVGLTAQWLHDCWQQWDRFWFSPVRPHTLCLMRVLIGLLLFYTHLVWSLDLMAFLGPNALITSEVSRSVASFQNKFAWTPLWYIESATALWTFHIVGLIVIFLFTIGLFTRITAILAWLFAVAYCQRATA